MYPTPCSCLRFFFFCLICLRDTEAWILELSISIFFENFYENWAYFSKECLFHNTSKHPGNDNMSPAPWTLVVFPRNYRDMMTQQSKNQSEAVRCYSRSLYYKPQKKFVPVGSGKQMLYVLNIIVRYSLIYVGTKDRQFLTFIHSFDLLF